MVAIYHDCVKQKVFFSKVKKLTACHLHFHYLSVFRPSRPY